MKAVLVIIGVLMVLVGGLWTGQGLGYIHGSPMTGVTMWAIIGPILALAGIGLAVLGLRRRARS